MLDPTWVMTRISLVIRFFSPNSDHTKVHASIILGFISAGSLPVPSSVISGSWFVCGLWSW
jgi:hypothetical protein